MNPDRYIVDSPLTEIENDRFDRTALMLNLSHALTTKSGDDWRAKSATIGLTGRWGSGKSTILNFLEKFLNTQRGIIVVRFDPWIIRDRDDLIDVYFRELIKQIGKSPGEKARDLANMLDSYRGAIEGVAGYAFPGAGLAAKFLPSARGRSLRQRKKTIEKRLSIFEGGIVVLIDELDRLDNEDIEILARFVKAVADFPNISYLLAYDPEHVQRALAKGGDTKIGEEYLKKIIQINIPIRELREEEIKDHLLKCLGGEIVCKLENNDLSWEDALSHCRPFLATPRDIKRVCANLQLLYRAVKDEVNIVDMFCYSVISASSTDVQRALQVRVDEVVIDPVVRDVDWADIFAQDGNQPAPSYFDKLKLDAEKFSEFKNLLKFIFPSERTEKERRIFGRIFKRNNLLTLIYLGNPPFRVPRRSVVEFWNTRSIAILIGFSARGLLGEFVDLLEVIFDELPNGDDNAAFLTFLAFLKGGDVRGSYEARNPIETLRWMLCRHARESDVRKVRVLKIWECLRASGEFLLSAMLVRHHMFALGLVSTQREHEYDVIVDQEEFAPIYKSELVRYRAHILAGNWIDGSCGVDPFYALLQGKAWTKKLRVACEGQIAGGAVSAFCALFMPPGYSAEKGTIAEFVSEDLVREAILDSEEADPFLIRCRERMIKYLDGAHWAEF